MPLPLGLLNLNPGNLRFGGGWQGETQGKGGFAAYPTMVAGIRAMCKQLLVYQDKYGLATPRQVIHRWAPPSENRSDLYTTFVCNMLDCSPDDRFKFRDPDFLFWMVYAIGSMECGPREFAEHVSDADIEAGIAAALA